MRILGIICAFLIVHTSIVSQNFNTDSLIKIVSSSKTKYEKTKSLLVLIDQYQKNFDPQCLEYAKQLQSLYNSNKEDTNFCVANQEIAESYFKKLDYNESAKAYKIAISSCKHKDFSSQHNIVLAKRMLAFCFERLKQNDSAFVYWKKSLDHAKAIKDSSSIVRVYNNIGDFAYKNISTATCIQYYDTSLQLAIKCKAYAQEANTLNDLAYLYVNKYDYKKAERYYKEALTIALTHKEYKYALDACAGLCETYSHQGPEYINKALEQFKLRTELLKKHSSLSQEKSLYSDYALFYGNQQNYEKALFYDLKCLALSKKLGHDIGLGYYNVGSQYFSLGNYSKAQKYFDSSLVINLKNNDKERIPDSYFALSRIHRNTGHYQLAFENLENYRISYDTILYAIYLNKIAEVETKYSTNKKIEENELLKKQKELDDTKINKAKQQNLFLLISVVLITVVLALTIWAYFIKRNTNNVLSRKNKEIEEKTEQLNIQATEIAKHQSQMNPHFIFNALISIQKFILKENKQSAIGYLSNLSKLMRLTLYNSEKEFITLEEEIKFLSFYINIELQRFNNKFEFLVNIASDIDEEDTMIPPMIIQPFLENAIKHGVSEKESGGKIELRISQINHANCRALKLEIIDNGIGREASKKLAQKFNAEHVSMAMNITRARIENYAEKYHMNKEGVLSIADVYDINNNAAGTIITVILPYI